MTFRQSLIAFALMTSAIPVAAFAQSTAPGAKAQDAQADAQAQKQRRAAEILRQMFPPSISTSLDGERKADAFGSEMGRLAYENAYMQLWTRPGLSLKERSMVTISMLIALGNEHELAVHLAAGLRNGLTPQQLEEIIYQASAYVGFPKAADALAVATKVIAEERKRQEAGK